MLIRRRCCQDTTAATLHTLRYAICLLFFVALSDDASLQDDRYF